MSTFTRRAATAIAALALAASGALVAVAPAQAAPASFTGVSISGLKKNYTAATTAYPGKSYSFTVNLTGSADDDGYTDINGDGVGVWYNAHDAVKRQSITVKAIKTKVKRPSAPSVTRPSTMTNGKNTFKLNVTKYTTPGVYEVSIPVTQYWKDREVTPTQYRETVKYAKARFTIKASTKNSRASTNVSSSSWRIGKTAKFTAYTPEYQKGAKVTLYYKKKGAKKYTKLTSSTVKVKNGLAKATLKTKKLTRAGHIYFKVSGVKYAPGYKTTVSKVTIRKR